MLSRHWWRPAAVVAMTVIACGITATAVIARLCTPIGPGHDLGIWQLPAARIAAISALVFLPIQCAALWLLLRPLWVQQSWTHKMHRRVKAVLKSGDLQIAFQPVLSMDNGEVVAVEALSRFSQKPKQGPDQWFAQADQVGLGVELELLALQRALTEAAKLGTHLDVAVNLSPCTLNDPRIQHMLMNAAISPLRLIVEITEHCVVSDYTQLSRSRALLREHGIRLSIDDAGAGYASFRHIVTLAPDLIKLDRAIVAGLDTDPARRALVRSMVGFAGECSAKTVAEGVETQAELATVKSLRVDQVQGYWTGRPTTDPDVWATWASSPSATPAHHLPLQRISSA